MALKIWDGFDHYKQDTDFLARSGFLQWSEPGTWQPVLTFVTGRNGNGRALQVYNSSLFRLSEVRAVWGDRNAEAFFGFAGFIVGKSIANNASTMSIALQDTVAGSPQLTIIFDGNNFSVQIFCGDDSGTSLLLTGNNVWTPDVWNFFEVHAKIDGGTGLCEVRCNGATIASVSGANTKNTANAWFDATDFVTYSTGILFGTLWVDDLYYCDTTTGAGTFPANTFLGDSRTVTLFANGESTVQWTPLSGTNWSQIAEQAMDSDTSYNHDATPGDEDQIAFQALSASIPVIFGIQLTIAARKDDASTRVLKTGVKSGSTVSYGSNHTQPDTNYSYFTDQWILDPATSANWTISGVNAVLGLYNLVS